ncbi:MAG: inner membrane-spanning protein YciB [Halieaceae bacterium]|jgi:intracellular septation protein
MKQLLEFIPIILFFTVYQFDGETVEIMGWTHTIAGIYSATAVLIVSTLISLPIIYWVSGELEKRLLWTAAAVAVFGGATLAFQNELFIQWKPSIFNWGMALAFGASQVFGSQNFLQRLMGQQIKLPDRIWTRICWVWVAHFTIVGILNLVVAYRFPEATWVSYKLWSGIAFTVLLMIITTLLMSPWLKGESEENQTSSEI